MAEFTTSREFIDELEAIVAIGKRNGILPETMAIALRLRADELDEQVPGSRAYK